MRHSRKVLSLLFAAALLLPAAYAQKPKTSMVERVGTTGIVQVEAESFKDLTARQKELAYWLGQASIAIEPIYYDQQSRFGLRQKYILEMIAAHPKGIDPALRKRIADYTKLFWANHGTHNEVTAQKFVPDFTPAELEKAALQALKNTPRARTTEEQLKEELAELRQSIFDASFEPQLTAKNPEGGLDIIQASSNNFYERGVTLAEVEQFKEQYPLNSRVAKVDGKLVEQVWRAGTPDGSIPPGLYAEYLSKAIGYLQRAKAVAEPGQAPVLDALIRYYQTGEPKDWQAFNILWVQNNPHVDFVHGFIESYRDPRGQKAAVSGYVSIVDEKLNQTMIKIAENAQYFEDHAPWADLYKKQGVKPPLAKAVETTIETGDMGVGTVGQNLPNENDVREKYGTKSVLLTGSTRAINRARGLSAIEEFGFDAEEKRISRAYSEEAADLLTALHEVIGHGSGRVNPKLTEDPSVLLKDAYSTLEEARSDLMALWHISDPKLRELGVVSHPDVAKAMYYSAVRNPLIQLRTITAGETIEEDHQRNRQLIVEYILDKLPGAIEKVKKDGKSFYVMRDFDKTRKGVGMLLAEIMRIKGEGDYAAGKALVDRYGVRFDPAVRDEIVARYKKLNLPTYLAGINADLDAKMDAEGNVTAVTMSYPRDFTKQRLEYAAMYHPEFVDGGDARMKKE